MVRTASNSEYCSHVTTAVGTLYSREEELIVPDYDTDSIDWTNIDWSVSIY